jgi:hypothetical protein
VQMLLFPEAFEGSRPRTPRARQGRRA